MSSLRIESVSVDCDTIHYKLIDETGKNLLKTKSVDAWIKYHHIEDFQVDFNKASESILLIPMTLYLFPVTYFYGIDIEVPVVDKELNDNIESIYNTYSKIYGPFKPEWRGKLIAKKIKSNEKNEKKFDKIVFYSGGVDACSAGLNNSGEGSVLVSVPSIEALAKNEGDLREEKFRLIKEFSAVTKSPWILISNNFNECVFDDIKIQKELKEIFCLSSPAFNFDGWFGIKYLANMCSVAPFAYLQGITKGLVMGSAFEQEGTVMHANFSGANPELSNSLHFAGMAFLEQDMLTTRRSLKVQNIINWCNFHKTKTKMWTCFDDKSFQCGKCPKCVRTQLNILVAKENPQKWGFDLFNEKKFNKFIKSYSYWEINPCWLWDNIDAIDEKVFYPYCDELLHWLKNVGYKEYLKHSLMKLKIKRLLRVFKIHRYPHYMAVVCKKILSK